MMASSALSFAASPQYHPVADGGRFSIGKHALWGRGYTVTPEIAHTIVDLGLRAGIKIEWGPDAAAPLPPTLLNVVAAIKTIELNLLGWDSYGGLALDDAAVLPSMQLVIESVNRCQALNVVPLPNGGLGLRWKHINAELEIDIAPSGKTSSLFEDLQSGETEEQEGADAADLRRLVHRYSALAA